MEKRFKAHIKDYYERHHLSNEQVCKLEHLQADGCCHSGSAKILRAPITRAALVILLLGAAWFGLQHYRNAAEVDRLVAEIAYNHNKQMGMEIESNAIETVKGFLTKLDFPLIASDRLPSDQWQLLGGRYCSLQGKLAAQLKVRQRDTGEVYTLFQTARPDGMPVNAPIRQTYLNGIEVRLWFERGLLLGMAHGR